MVIRDSKYLKEQLLIEKVFNKDPDSINKILPKLRKQLSFFLFKQGKLNSENLRELVNETLIAAFHSKIPYLKCSAVYYLSKIGEKVWLNKQRKKKEIPVSMQDLDSLPFVDRILELTDEDLFILRLALSKLPKQSQKILELYSKGIDSETASKRLGFPNKGTYQSRKYESLMNLKKQYNRLMRLTRNNY